ncbi:FAD-dependent oxidoreductase [Agriterribacter sp.]|uniref:NAD(P)/FAD-dependent oxidoreductase n=1 Tax=Agriterribacter sp. TaxID=2821509 RepID=UPI002CAF3AEE|nr:FAD-dependent oxidoreductase [Agriterribacter sp.]HRP56306.1 FAD-dependent oxidoreductase [Agriterribacter sp.]
MDLRSHYPYWLLRHGIINVYPPLTENIKTDVVVMGGGITGALLAWHLCQAGIAAVVVDKRHIGMGSTAASTAMIQYEIDIPLYQLEKITGKKNAAQSYLLCYQSLLDLASICKSLKAYTGFAFKPSFQQASFKKDIAGLKKEQACRKKIGIPTEWLDEKIMQDRFGINKYGGLLSERAAELDPYGFTHALLYAAVQKGLRVFDRTKITAIEHSPKKVTLTTEDKRKIQAKYLVIACGYESQQYISKTVQRLHATYAIVSEPLSTAVGLWYKNCLMWETRLPYLYFRTTKDNRIIIGGKDDDKSPAARDAALPQKAKLLEKAFNRLLPHIAFKTDFEWAGTFASTKDGLPYIGVVPEHPRTFFGLGLGGNGITFGILAAQIIRDRILGKKNVSENLFGFNR